MGGKGKKSIKTDRKKGVPFKMMFRHHMDPDYYDPKANDKIFVPDVPTNALSENQKQIIESFPERDRGIFKEGQGNPIVEEDPLEAVVKKMKIKKKENKKKKKKVTFQQDGSILKEGDPQSDDEDDSDLAESDEEGNEDEYDEEDEDYSETDDLEEETKGEVAPIKTSKNGYDANEVVKKVQLLKPADGVKFAQYDEYGLPKDDGFDYKQFIVTDDLKPSDLYIEAPPEMVEQMYIRTGYNRDVDKDFSAMTEEEKAVYLCMTDDVGQYDELEDDFLMLANEGKPALEVVEKETTSSSTINQDGKEFANKGVVIVKDQEEENLKALRDKYKKQLGLGQYKQSNQQDEDQDQEEEEEHDDQDEGDEEHEENKQDFMQVLEDEYADDQIGDVEIDEPQEDQITKELLDEALDEFIESQKLRDRKLYREFKADDQPLELIPRLKPKAQAQAEEEQQETEQDREELRRKALALNEQLEKEMEERGSDYEDYDPYNHDSDDEKHKWDCNTILTTFTNTDNHPGVIKTTRVVKQKAKIELHKQFKVPIDALMAEQVIIHPTEKLQDAQDATKTLKQGPYQRVDEEIHSEQDSNSDQDDNQPEGDAKDLKKQRKKQMKEDKREKRKLKKELKVAFKTQNTKLVKATTTEIGQIKSGVSIKKIY